MTLAAEEPETIEAPPTWWSRSFRMFQTNLREIDALLDVDRTLDVIEDYGADTWLINAGGIMAFHPSDLPFQTRNPLLAERPGGDLLGDAITAAHARGIRLMARMDFSKVPRALADEHPEWAFVDPAGRRQEYHGLVSVTPTGDYYQDRSLDILDEVIDRYPVDGFFFNWFGFNEVDYDGDYRGVCHAATSLAAFRAATGSDEVPDGPAHPLYSVWRRWADATVARLTGRIRDHIAARRPDAGLILGTRADIRFHEANNAVGRPFWRSATSAAVSGFRAARPEVPVLVNSVAFLDMPYRMAAEQPQLFGHYLLQTIARGGNPSTYIMGTPGDIAYGGLEPGRAVTRFHRDHRALYDGLEGVADVLLVQPTRRTATQERHAESMEEFRGWYLALQEAHVPFDVLALDDIPTADDSTLTRTRVMVLPDVGEPAVAVRDALRAWTAAGGRLVATGDSFSDPAALDTLPGAAVRRELTGRRALRSTYVRDGRSMLPIYGRRLERDWTDRDELRLAAYGQAPFGPPEKAHGNAPTDQPGYALRHTSAGTSARVSWTIGRAYAALGLTSLRDLAVRIVDEVRGAPPLLETDLPAAVEITALRSGDDLVLHLLNLTGATPTTIAAAVPVVGARLRLRAGDAATSLLQAAPCALHRVDDVVEVELPELGDFDVIVVRGGAR
jgi:hypothetical protein